MQQKPNETTKIAGLVLALIVVLGFVVFQIVRATQGSSTSTTNTATMNTNGASTSGSTSSSSPNLQVASATGANPTVGAGQVRYFDDTLDADPTPGNPPTMSSGNGGAFRVFKPAITQQASPLKSFGNPNPKLRQGGGSAIFVNPFDANKLMNPQSKPQPPKPIEPTIEARLDGVVTGEDGFAEITVRVTSSGKEVLEQTIFRHIGEKIGDYPAAITSLLENGIVLNGHIQTWIVGQTMLLSGPTPPSPTNQTGLTTSSLNVPTLSTPPVR